MKTRIFYLVFAVGYLFVGAWPATAQTNLDVVFRYFPQSGENFVRVFLPGEFNGWGPNSGGRIAPGAVSQMSFDATLGQWLYTVSLQVRSQPYSYKVHFHLNADGSNNQWISDPLNDRIDPADNNNSLVTIEDPMVFQLARKENEAGEIVEISAGVFGSQAITAITFEINGAEQDGTAFFDAGKKVFRHVLPAPVPGGSQFKINATDALGGFVSGEVGVIPPMVDDSARPDGVRDGVNYAPSDPTKVTLSLFAPGKNIVHVVGDFNDWQVDGAFLMKRDVAGLDSTHWWLEIDGLNPGQEYAYQYLIDGALRIADLYSEKILDEGNDPFIQSTTYPNLKPYPAGMTQGFVSVLQTEQSVYPWIVDDFEKPPQGELIIYELLVRDFIASHDYRALADTLDYLGRLGINAIELMPVAEFGGNINWGYQPQFVFAPDKYYGPATDLKRFIDEAHQRDIAVILDVVYNHVDLPSPVVELFGATNDNPWINIPARHPFNVFFDINHENTYTQYWLDRVNAHWLSEYKVDGFRFDLSKGFTQTNTGNDVGAWGNYDASRIRLLKRMADQIWDIEPDAYVILEHFAADTEEVELATYRTGEGLPGMMFWNNANHRYNEATMGYNTGSNSNFSHAYYGSGGRNWPIPNLISYMQSHDEQWLMFKNIEFGACANSSSGGDRCRTDPGEYNVRHLPTALERMKMVGAFFFLLPGPKLMFQFGELGYGFGDAGEQCLRTGGNNDCPSSAPDRTGPKPIRWDYGDEATTQGFLRTKLFKTWAALIKLRNENDVFRSTDTAVTLNLDQGFKSIVLSHPTMDVTIVGNFDVSQRESSITFANVGTWYDFFSGAPLEVTESPMTINLEPGEFHIFTSARVEPPEPGIINPPAEIPAETRLEQNYPNPFNRVTTIRFTTSQTGPVRLDVFDVLGRRVATLVDGAIPEKTHAVTFDAGHLPSGVYLYKLRFADRVESRHMVLVK